MIENSNQSPNSNSNDIVYQARLHWILFFWPILFLIFAFYLLIAIQAMQQIGWLFTAVGVLWLIIVTTAYNFSLFVIKRKQVILTTGLFIRQTLDIPMNKIESIDIRQTLLGSICQYGTLVITGTGGTRQYINYLSRPLTCRRYIEQLLHR